MPVRDPRKGGAARKYSDRLVLDGIFFVLRSGCQWRMIPRDLLPWDAAYRWYRTWVADGTVDRIHDTLRDQVRIAAGRDPNPSAAVLDAQSIKSSEGGADRGFDMGNKTTGRKRHLIVDTLGLLPVVMVTAACVQDRPGGRKILQRLAARFPSVSLVVPLRPDRDKWWRPGRTGRHLWITARRQTGRGSPNCPSRRGSCRRTRR